MKGYQAGEGVGLTSQAVGAAIRGKHWNRLATILNAARAKTCTQNISDVCGRNYKKLLDNTGQRGCNNEARNRGSGKISEGQYVMERS